MLGVWRLQLLREVGRRGTIRAAAAAMSVTPSAVSQQLRILEAEAGVALLEPHGRLVRLTDAGEMLVRHADAITAAIVAAESDLAATRDEVAGTLRIAAFPTAARAIVPGVIAELGRANPRLRLTLRDLETEESLAALRLDEVDLALVDEYDESARVREPGVELLDLMDDPLFVAVPPDLVPSGLAARAAAPGGTLPLEGLAAVPWIMDTETSTIYRAVLRHFRRSGFEPIVRSNCRDYGVIVALVEAGLGAAVLPGLALRERDVRAIVAPLDPPLHRRVMVALKPERRAHPAVATTLAALLGPGAGDGDGHVVAPASAPAPSPRAGIVQQR
ncbi:MAG: LysR family transcriptional regulator [Chloroflexi bacterium]|nr:LysR family transcriptional regulator [Chloroflexota bacterium]